MWMMEPLALSSFARLPHASVMLASATAGKRVREVAGGFRTAPRRQKRARTVPAVDEVRLAALVAHSHGLRLASATLSQYAGTARRFADFICAPRDSAGNKRTVTVISALMVEEFLNYEVQPVKARARARRLPAVRTADWRARCG